MLQLLCDLAKSGKNLFATSLPCRLALDSLERLYDPTRTVHLVASSAVGMFWRDYAFLRFRVSLR